MAARWADGVRVCARPECTSNCHAMLVASRSYAIARRLYCSALNHYVTNTCVDRATRASYVAATLLCGRDVLVPRSDPRMRATNPIGDWAADPPESDASLVALLAHLRSCVTHHVRTRRAQGVPLE